jgi:hypothetical protein
MLNWLTKAPTPARLQRSSAILIQSNQRGPVLFNPASYFLGFMKR